MVEGLYLEESLVDGVMVHLKDPKVQAAVKVKSEVVKLSQEFLRREGFVELLPTILSPITDPLNHDVFEVTIDYAGTRYRLTQSMIFHKQIALHAFEKVFITSPNVRLETPDNAGVGKYLFEFVQVDLEIKGAKREDVMDLIERLLVYVFEGVQESCAKELKICGVERLRIPSPPFPKVKYLEAKEKYGHDFEKVLSQKAEEPFWLVDIAIEDREFYDKLSPDGKTLLDMDLVLPLGYGEVLSGGEREHEYEKIVKRMAFKGSDFASMKWYLDLVKRYGLYPSAGCGFGIERLTRYICRLNHVKYTRLFPKVPGEISI